MLARTPDLRTLIPPHEWKRKKEKRKRKKKMPVPLPSAPPA
jgi:hypothetical protein